MMRTLVGATPTVSIIMPAYNAAITIKQAISSVIEQEFEDWELIIVDDYSSDETFSIAESFEQTDHRVRVVGLSNNGGPAKARNEALKLATGRYVAFLDSDDLWLPEKLARQIRFMQEGEIGFSYTCYRRFRETPDCCGPLINVPASLNYQQILANTAVACLTVVIDRKYCGDFYFKDVRHEDYALWLAILKRGVLAVALQEDLARYRIGSASLTQNKFKSALWVWKIYRNVENLSLRMSIRYFTVYAWNALKKHGLDLNFK